MSMQDDTTSNAPDDCPDCGKRWSHIECVQGSTFPRPGGDWTGELIPPEPGVEAFVAECFAGPSLDEWRAMDALAT